MSIRESGKKITITNETTIGFSIAYNDTDKKEREHQIGITAGKSSERTTFANLKFVK